jgi:hypothetical protein
MDYFNIKQLRQQSAFVTRVRRALAEKTRPAVRTRNTEIFLHPDDTLGAKERKALEALHDILGPPAVDTAKVTERRQKKIPTPLADADDVHEIDGRLKAQFPFDEKQSWKIDRNVLKLRILPLLSWAEPVPAPERSYDPAEQRDYRLAVQLRQIESLLTQNLWVNRLAQLGAGAIVEVAEGAFAVRHLSLLAACRDAVRKFQNDDKGAYAKVLDLFTKAPMPDDVEEAVALAERTVKEARAVREIHDRLLAGNFERGPSEKDAWTEDLKSQLGPDEDIGLVQSAVAKREIDANNRLSEAIRQAQLAARADAQRHQPAAPAVA